MKVLSQKEREKALAFVQCEDCAYDLETGEGQRSCHWGDCPYLPEALTLVCPTCRFNFGTMEGDPECGETPRCEFAIEVAPVRLALFHAWQALHAPKPSR